MQKFWALFQPTLPKLLFFSTFKMVFLIDYSIGILTFDEVADLLNTLYEENKELKEDNKQLKQKNKKLQGEYDYLLWLYNGLGCEYDWLKEENNQLKRKNKRSYYTL